MNELKEIWKRNSIRENVSWLGNILVFLVILPYCLIKDYWCEE